jgi:hypothetical protein
VSADLGELTKDIHDDEPHRRKVQTAKTDESFLGKPRRIGAVVAKKHMTIFPIRERRKGVTNQVTKGEFIYKRSDAREDSPLYGKWYKLRKGENAEDAIKNRGLEGVLVDSPPESG